MSRYLCNGAEHIALVANWVLWEFQFPHISLWIEAHIHRQNKSKINKICGNQVKEKNQVKIKKSQQNIQGAKLVKIALA